MSKIIALLTDFGLDDIYVGVVKGAILRICPDAQLVDITHEIQAQNVRQGAFALLNAYSYFPSDTIFLVVVDPGVGSNRKPVAAQAGSYCFVAPDNGVLSYALMELDDDVQTHELKNPDYWLSVVSNTFHGRDIFAPAAAYLAAGKASLGDFGPPVEQLIQLPEPELEIGDEGITGEVIWIDHFGNIITSIGQWIWQGDDTLYLIPKFGEQREQPREMRISAIALTKGGYRIEGIQQAYHAAPIGELLLQIDSNGYLEIAVNQGNAAEKLGVRVGDIVTLEYQ